VAGDSAPASGACARILLGPVGRLRLARALRGCFRGRRYGIRRQLRVVRSECKHGAADFPCAELAGLFRATPDVALDQSLSAAVKVWVRLLLFVLLLGAIAAVTFYVCNHFFLHQSVAGPVNYHYWIHSELGLSAKQESALEPIEAKFAGRRDELFASIREANRELAEALLADKSDSERVKGAVQKIHRAQGELQQAVLEHVFDMRSVITPEQYDRLIELTAHALRDAPELR
jgi:Spy/CpxP family protein refolding chaperone